MCRTTIPVLIDVPRKKEYHCARWIVVDADTIVENGCIEVEDGRIKAVCRKPSGSGVVDHGPGILMPPLVNCHLHLELSALKSAVPYDKGFGQWVNTLLEKRDALGTEKLVRGASSAVRDLERSGTLFVGDVSTLNITGSVLKASKLRGVCFNEYLGTQVERWHVEKENHIFFSLAGHAPHTTSPEVLRGLKNTANSEDLPFSIHLAESEEESEFIRERKGSWADFLTSRGIDFSGWGAKGTTPVEYADSIGVLGKNTLVIHALDVSRKDLEIIALSGSRVGLCPRSNRNLHGKLPDIPSMLEYGIEPALGSDSLASCESLDILDEMAFVKEKYPDLSAKTIFKMGTINGARALGVEKDTGSLSPGTRACFLYLPLEAGNRKTILRKVINHE